MAQAKKTVNAGAAQAILANPTASDAAKRVATSALSQLTFLTDAPARPSSTAAVTDPTERRRLNFIASLKTQIEVAKALEAGKSYSVDQKHYVTVRGPDGKPEKDAAGKIKRVLKEEPVKKDAWFWLSPGDSTYYVTCWYSVRKLDLIGKGTTIKCGKSLQDVINILLGLVDYATEKQFDKLLTGLQLGNRG